MSEKLERFFGPCDKQAERVGTAHVSQQSPRHARSRPSSGTASAVRHEQRSRPSSGTASAVRHQQPSSGTASAVRHRPGHPRPTTQPTPSSRYVPYPRFFPRQRLIWVSLCLFLVGCQPARNETPTPADIHGDQSAAPSEEAKRPLRVAAASDLRHVFGSLKNAFEQRVSTLELVPTCGSSGQLA
ncbi:MAG: hypothetical protein ACKPEY_04540, partial [Planctomycetota bacterium]